MGVSLQGFGSWIAGNIGFKGWTKIVPAFTDERSHKKWDDQPSTLSLYNHFQASGQLAYRHSKLYKVFSQ